MGGKVDLPQVISHPSILWGPPPPSENPVSSDISVAIFFSLALSFSLYKISLVKKNTWRSNIDRTTTDQLKLKSVKKNMFPVNTNFSTFQAHIRLFAR